MGIRQRAAIVIATAAVISTLSAAPALAQTSFTVASISAPYGSGVVHQTITVSGPVVGTSGDLVIIAGTGMQYLVTGLDISPSTNAVCTQVYNNHYTVQWHCVPNSTWGEGTFTVLMDTGSPSNVYPPGTGAWPNAETTSIADAGVGGAEASGTLSLLPPGPRVPPSVPVTTLPNPVSSKPATAHTAQPARPHPPNRPAQPAHRPPHPPRPQQPPASPPTPQQPHPPPPHPPRQNPSTQPRHPPDHPARPPP